LVSTADPLRTLPSAYKMVHAMFWRKTRWSLGINAAMDSQADDWDEYNNMYNNKIASSGITACQ
jgi:hypothetical protein